MVTARISFLDKSSEMVCHDLLPRAEKEWLVHSYPTGFVSKMGPGFLVSSLMP